MSDKDRYDSKYGEKTASWNTRNSDGSIKQYNVKDVESGDHSFYEIKTGRMGTALGSYRPFREEKDDKD